MSGDFDQVLTAQLKRSAFWTQVGFKLEQSSEGKARVRLPYDEGNTTAATALHGGAIAATLDVAGCLAACASDLKEGVSGRLLSCDVSYIAGALGEDIFGEAEVLRRGKEIVYSTVRAVNGDGKLLASGSHIYHLSTPENIPAAPTGIDQIAGQGREVAGIGGLPIADAAIVAKNIGMLGKMDGRMPYMSQINWQFKAGDYGYAEFLLPWKEHSIGDDGGLASGALLSAIDHSGSLAAWMTTELGRRDLFGSTVNTKIQTFAPAIKRDVIVKARAAGGSGTLINSDVDIITLAGEPVASGSTIYRIVKRSK
ncbi:MAG: PaaI family thioesterase [Pseudomonadales bacterium]|nr:PaaI family thioesterase [Pseudomonadales bacterium]